MSLIEAYIDYLRHEQRRAANTVEAYRRDLEQWRSHVLGGRPVECFDPMSVTQLDLRHYMGALLKEGIGAVSVRRKMSALRGFFTFLERNHGLTVNPTATLAMPKTPKRLPVIIRPDETERLLDAPVPPDDYDALLMRVIIDILYNTGLRCSELCSLKDRDTDTSRRSLKVLGKRDKERVIPFGPELAETIAAYRLERDADPARRTADPDAPLLCRADGRPLNRGLVYSRLHRHLADAGVNATRLSPHTLRHSMATDVLNAGASLPTVKQLLGHASLSSTQIYTHLSFGDLLKNYRQAHPRANNRPQSDV